MFQENAPILFEDAEEAPEILVTDLSKLPALDAVVETSADSQESEI